MKPIYIVSVLNRRSDLSQPIIPTLNNITHHRGFTGCDKDVLIKEALIQIAEWEKHSSHRYKIIVGVAQEEVATPPIQYTLLPL